ncbi:hypothetical protein SAMN05444008_11557 [Cnuella takakiae]|uniref:Uncharacterized protein n=1 Tax=Cnuella takakiae TaxID=1302690 RepID=A0A1M5G116_9BACT|nr:DUF6712 family protein [Cnuella takakiae]OLY92291.1 hypothetical protein BUE76_10595 [Cnuella takakiae]SHF97455.1 hypothetical protein SAMN05444008_11557 [Cnuella takakiae]
MAILSNDKDLVRDFVRINFINQLSSFPDWDAAEDRYLVPVMGFDLHNQVKALAEVEPGGPLTDDEKRNAELLRLCRTVVAPLAYMLEMPLIQAQLTDAGLRTISSDNMQAAHRWEYNNVLQQLADKGSYGIEALLRFLIHNKEHYPAWTESTQYREFENLLFATGEEFNKYFRLHQPHRVFWQLRPLIREAEDFYVAAAIGNEFYQVLKGKVDPSKEERTALDFCRKAVSQITMAMAVEKRSVAITEEGFTLLMGAGNADSSNAGDTPALSAGLSMLHDSCSKSGDAYLLKLQDYLNSMASDAMFAEYFTSSYYEAPANPTCPEPSKNAHRKIFGL